MKYLYLVFLAFLSFCSPSSETSPNYLIQELLSLVNENHVNAKEINDEFSEEFFHHYLSKIDESKMYFTQKDIHFLSMYKKRIDDDLLIGNMAFYQEVDKLLTGRLNSIKSELEKLLIHKFDFDLNESYAIPHKGIPYAQNVIELKSRWRKFIKKEVLDEQYLKNNIHSEEEPDAHLIKIIKLYSGKIDDLINLDETDKFQKFINAYLNLQGPQSEYLSLEEKQKWNNEFNRSLVGVGIRFKVQDNYPHILDLSIGGPAWKTTQLEAGDVILKMIDEENIEVDFFGKNQNAVLNFLKGKQNTELSLVVKKKDGSIKSVNLERDKIEYDQATAFVLNSKTKDNNIGYIRLPRFYVGEDGCATHIWNALHSFNKKEIKGLILDLRNNKGGSSGQAREILGNFISSGNLMHVKYKDGSFRTLSDDDGVVHFDGKLIVLVNGRSASASELVSGTLQDYCRAVIVGSDHTFGKGSMQRFFEVHEKENEAAIGEVKLSIGNFYTANGRSPQYYGIIPDIILPDTYSYTEFGERKMFSANKTEHLRDIAPVGTTDTSSINSALRSQSNKRVSNKEFFKTTKRKAKYLSSTRNEMNISLDRDQYYSDLEKQKNKLKEFDAGLERIVQLKATVLEPADKSKLDSIKLLQAEKWINQIEKDPYVFECYEIMMDMLG